jgi:Na+/H+-dicarboxylate symporter
MSQKIFLGLFVGVIAGILINWYQPNLAPTMKVFSTIFLRLIKMIIAPLIFATLVAGIAGAGHFKDVGRMGLRAILYFEVVTTLALVVGLVLVNVLKPGLGVALPATATNAAMPPQTWDQILLHVIQE